MAIDESLLKNEEKAVFALRALYSKNGYTQFKMSKFEEYDLYMKNKDFLVSQGVITFNDTDGKLLALKPDVTLSILKNSIDKEGLVQKVYYNENVYRISDSSHTYKEIMQSGLECIGDITEENSIEVVLLAFESLKLINENFVVNLSHMGLVEGLLEDYNIKDSVKNNVIKAICDKNSGALRDITDDEQFNALNILKPSSSNLLLGVPTHLTTLLFKSVKPS